VKSQKIAKKMQRESSKRSSTTVGSEGRYLKTAMQILKTENQARGRAAGIPSWKGALTLNALFASKYLMFFQGQMPVSTCFASNACKSGAT